MTTQLSELKRLLAAVDSNMSSAEAQLLIRDTRQDIEHGRRSIAKAIKIVAELETHQVAGTLPNCRAAYEAAALDLSTIMSLLGFTSYPGIDPMLRAITDLILAKPAEEEKGNDSKTN